MTSVPPTTTILFADLAGSTGLYERLGDSAAHAVVSEALGRWTDAIGRGGGRVVKTMGDGLLAVLSAPDRAIQVAEELHRGLDAAAPGSPAKLVGRVGLHAGAVIERDGDVFGDAVNVAARLAAVAKPRQILASGELVQLLPPASTGDLRPLGRVRVRGRATEVELHEWVWEKAMVTRMVSNAPQAGDVVTLAVTTASKATQWVTDAHPRMAIGRQPFNDLVVEDAQVSRVHAVIEKRGARFVVRDESTNGTHVMPMNAATAVLRGEEGDLGTMGFIGLGAAPFPGQPHTIEYQVHRTPAAAGAG